MRINTERLRILDGKILLSHLQPDPADSSGFTEVVGEVGPNRHPFSIIRPVPNEGMAVAPQVQRIYVPTTGHTKYLINPRPDPEAVKFMVVNGRVYIEEGNFTVSGHDLVWHGPLTLKPNDQVFFFCYGRDHTKQFVRVDPIEAHVDGQMEFTLSGISRKGVGEVILDGKTYFYGQSFTMAGDRLYWTDLARPIKKGDQLVAIFYLQNNSAAMFRYQQAFRISSPGQTVLPLDVMPADEAGVRVYIDGYLYLPNVSGHAGFFNVNGRSITWTDSAFPLPLGKRVNIVIPTAALVTQDPPVRTEEGGSAMNSSEPIVTYDGQTVIPVANPPAVRTKSILLAAGLAYTQGLGYDLDEQGRILWDSTPLKTVDELRLIGFNDEGVAAGTVIERLPILNGVPGPLTSLPADPSKVIAIVSSEEDYGGLALFAGGYFTVRGKQLTWEGEYPPVPLKDTDSMIVVYYRDLSVAAAMIHDRKLLTEEDVLRRTYNLGIAPREPQRSIWTLNGMIMRWGIDYTISGSSLWYIGTQVQLRAGDEAGIVTL